MVRSAPSALFNGLSPRGSNGAEAFLFATNQAAIPDSAGIYLGIYGERKFGIRGLEALEAAVLIPAVSGYFGISGSAIGGMNYREGGLSLGYGLPLGGRVSVGVQFNRYSVRKKGYGSSSSINMEGGVELQVTSQLQAGLHFYNPTGSGWSKIEDEFLPRVYTMLFAYEVSPALVLHTAIRKVENRAVAVMCGFQYAFAATMVARAGIDSSTGAFYLGSGLQLKLFWIQGVISTHPQLGFTPGLMLTYHLPGK